MRFLDYQMEILTENTLKSNKPIKFYRLKKRILYRLTEKGNELFKNLD